MSDIAAKAKELAIKNHLRRRHQWIEEGRVSNLPPGEYKSDENHHRAKYSNAQVTGVRAFLEANKRYSGQGMSWVDIGTMYNVGFSTVRRLQSPLLTTTGNVYRPSCIPTEQQIQAALEVIEEAMLGVRQLKGQRAREKARANLAHKNASSMAEVVQASKEHGAQSRFSDLCRERAIPVPTTRQGIEDAISTLVCDETVQENMSQLNNLMEEAINLLEKKDD